MATSLRPRYDPESWDKLPADATPGWARFIVRLLQEDHYKHTPGNKPLYQKGIQYLDRPAHVLKNRDTRIRVVLQRRAAPFSNVIDAYVSIPTPAKPGSPHIPRYPQHGDPRIHHTTWEMSEKGLTDLYFACKRWMSERAIYQEPDFYRIPLSMDPAKGFAFGRIEAAIFHSHHPQTKEAGGFWELEVLQGFSYLTASEESTINFFPVKTYLVKASALKYDAVSIHYILIYKDEDTADIVSNGDVRAFCKVIPRS